MDASFSESFTLFDTMYAWYNGNLVTMMGYSGTEWIIQQGSMFDISNRGLTLVMYLANGGTLTWQTLFAE